MAAESSSRNSPYTSRNFELLQPSDSHHPPHAALGRTATRLVAVAAIPWPFRISARTIDTPHALSTSSPAACAPAPSARTDSPSGSRRPLRTHHGGARAGEAGPRGRAAASHGAAGQDRGRRAASRGERLAPNSPRARSGPGAPDGPPGTRRIGAPGRRRSRRGEARIRAGRPAAASSGAPGAPGEVGIPPTARRLGPRPVPGSRPRPGGRATGPGRGGAARERAGTGFRRGAASGADARRPSQSTLVGLGRAGASTGPRRQCRSGGCAAATAGSSGRPSPSRWTRWTRRSSGTCDGRRPSRRARLCQCVVRERSAGPEG